MDRIEPRELDLVDHGGLRAEQMAADRSVVPSAERGVEVELRVGPHRDAPVEREELMPIREDGLLVALRSEVPDLEVLQHSDSPEDRAALDIVLPGGGFEAWEEVVAVGELHDDRVAFLLRLHRLTGR